MEVGGRPSSRVLRPLAGSSLQCEDGYVHVGIGQDHALDVSE